MAARKGSRTKKTVPDKSVKRNKVREPNRIRVVREELGLSQQALATKIGTSQQQVQRIEAGRQSVRHDLALKICAALGTPIGKVFPRIGKAVRTIHSDKGTASTAKVPALRTMRAVLADATDLHDWANRIDAFALLPLLIRRLALFSLQTVEKIHFRSEEGVRLSGWDGILRVSQGNAFIPPGTSGWEMGTDKNVKGKADYEYDNRVKDPLGLLPANSTFVFVTPRRWKNKEEWAQAKRNEGVWKDVRVIDADDLSAWLEISPSVHIWFSILIGKRPSSVNDLQNFWQTWSGATQPTLVPELLLSGRAASVAQVQEFLRARPSVLEIKADTREEALAFLTASILSLGNDEERERTLARVVIVEDHAAWRQLAGWNRSLVLVPSFDDRRTVPEALTSGHSIVIPLGGGDQPSQGAIVLPRLNRDEAKKALEGMHIPADRAGELAALARRSMEALRRTIAISASTLTPGWANAENARSLLPALLTGQWNDRNPNDQKALSDIAGKEYAEITTALLRWSNEHDPPVRRVGDIWMLVSKEDGWSLLSRYVSTQDLERFETVALEVLSERDPEYELPVNERWEANLRGKVLKRSEEIRKGVAETLAIMGSLSEVHPISGVLSGQEWATRIITKLLSQPEDWTLWVSLSPVLQFVAEAAPEAFLSALERAISDPNKHLAKIFADGETTLLQGSPHTGLLWSLEVLAWPPELLAQTALILARLAGLDPGGRMENRPINSLREIFLCWSPGTAANLDKRLRVIDMIRKREPNVAWDLLCSLLPRIMDSSNPTAKPSWRDWKPEETSSVTYAEVFRATQEIVERQLEDVGSSGSRWKAIIEDLHEVGPEFDKIVSRLGSLDPQALTEVDKVAIWDSLRKFVSQHRRFHDAQWALPAELVDRLDELQGRFEPNDPIVKRVWLFSDDPDLPYKRSDDEYEEAIEEAQTKSIEDLHALGGLPLIFKLAEQVQCPWKVGTALGTTKLYDGSEGELLTQCLGSPNRSLQQLGMNFLIKRCSTKGLEWVVGLQVQNEWTGWTPQQRADYFRCLAFTDRTTREALDLQDEETQRLYWSEVGPSYGHGKLEGEFCEMVVEKFVKYDQLETAIVFLDLYAHRKECPVRPKLIAEVLTKATRGSVQEIDWKRHGHRVAKLLEHLAKSGQVPDTELAQLEWYFLPFLRFDRRPITLFKALADDPEFFVEMLKFVYLAENQEPQEATEEQRTRAHYAHDLLLRWHRGPGLDADGSVSPEKLKTWISKALELASAHGRLKAAEHQIGKVLAHYPSGADGAWPHDAIRDLIEEHANDEMQNGITLGILNSRGVVSRSLYEGGRQEKAIAERYKEYARILSDKWPRTSMLMKEISRSYELQARREDLETEIRQDLWN